MKGIINILSVVGLLSFTLSSCDESYSELTEVVENETRCVFVDSLMCEYYFENSKLIIDKGSAWDAPVYVLQNEIIG